MGAAATGDGGWLPQGPSPGLPGLHRRLCELRLPNLGVYQAHLEGQYATLETLTDTTISRFCRDRGVFASLQREEERRDPPPRSVGQ